MRGRGDRKGMVWRSVVRVVVGDGDSERYVMSPINQRIAYGSSFIDGPLFVASALITRTSAISQFRRAGASYRASMISNEVVDSGAVGDLLNTLCVRLEWLMRYEEVEWDLLR